MLKKILFTTSLLALLCSCGGDDDICLSTDSTPRLKLKFKNLGGQFVQLDSLYIDVDYGKTSNTNVLTAARVDSAFVPLRIDDNPYTDVYIRTRKNGNQSIMRINYQSKAIYVSPACGFKKNYENMAAELLQSLPVQSIEANNTTLSNEASTNFYLRF